MAGGGRPSPAISSSVLLLLIVREVEQVKQIADGRAVHLNVRTARRRYRVREVVAAAVGHSLQAPVALDELQDRNVIRIIVRNVARLRVRRYYEENNTRAVTEEIERLYIPGVIVASTLVLRDEDRRVL